MNLIQQLARKTDSKIVMLVIDGLGGLQDPATGKTELETACTPNLDALAAESVCGLSLSIAHGITTGSAPGHLGLFGYDPVGCSIGRGVLEALGIGFCLQPGDMAVRGNFCTLDDKGLISDRRAGRIATDKSAGLCQKLDGMTIEGVQVIVRPVKDHRLVVVFRGEGLDDDISETDPQQTGAVPLSAIAGKAAAEKTAKIVNCFIDRAKEILACEQPANMVLLRGFSQQPDMPTMTDIFKLTPAAIASYPMYRGLASIVGMDVLETGPLMEDEMATLRQVYNNYDFFFIHIKETDATGEDGNFSGKVAALEHVDRLLPQITELKPDVIIVTGDHSTPAMLKGHSWHPVPLLLYSQNCRPDGVEQFTETACIVGGLGQLLAKDIMPLAMANALKLNKFGA